MSVNRTDLKLGARVSIPPTTHASDTGWRYNKYVFLHNSRTIKAIIKIHFFSSDSFGLAKMTQG